MFVRLEERYLVQSEIYPTTIMVLSCNNCRLLTIVLKLCIEVTMIHSCSNGRCNGRV